MAEYSEPWSGRESDSQAFLDNGLPSSQSFEPQIFDFAIDR
jgi:hypothetical protein